MDCLHLGPRHIVELANGEGSLDEFWMCCACGEIVGRYKKVNTAGCDFDLDKRHWINSKGKTVSEYLPL
jgi:hypothetical protein